MDAELEAYKVIGAGVAALHKTIDAAEEGTWHEFRCNYKTTAGGETILAGIWVGKLTDPLTGEPRK